MDACRKRCGSADGWGPGGPLFNSDLLCPSGMPFLDELYQPLAVGPVGQPFITGPLVKHVSEPDCRRTNRIHSGPPGGSTGVLDAVNQTGSDVQDRPFEHRYNKRAGELR